ncbi:molecular chaperone [Variovorax sp. UMC13]|uniref:fimbrial biogenesis chaperone n=1 Tax=Variovorax sp. UMC13 TaxID=1862326 RepID=UPI0016003DBB|nr:molecular chaperone [Variovorax sp. UMC13]
MTLHPTTARTLSRLALCGLALVVDPGHAASLQVAPVTLTLPPRQNADGLWLSNNGDAPLQAQVRIYRWTQVEGEDRLEPTRDLTLSPPMLQVGAGERQLVRVIRLGPPPDSIEASYRVIVDELPVPVAADTPPRPGLDFVLRYSLPIFLRPLSDADRATPPPPMAALTATLVDDGGQTQLQLENRGSGHVQLADLVFIDAAGKRLVLRQGLVGYVLPGGVKRWPVSAPGGAEAARRGTFKARINGAMEESALLPSDATLPQAHGPR